MLKVISLSDPQLVLSPFIFFVLSLFTFSKLEKFISLTEIELKNRRLFVQTGALHKMNIHVR